MQQEFPIPSRVRITETLSGDGFISRVRELERCGGEFFRIKYHKQNGVYDVQCDVPCRGTFIEEFILI